MNILEVLKKVKNSLEVTSPIMEGRSKGSLVLNVYMTIDNWDYLTDREKNEDYVVFTIKEDSHNFYFGGSIITDKFKKIDLMGEETVGVLKANGIPVIFEEKKSKNSGMKYHDMIIKA